MTSWQGIFGIKIQDYVYKPGSKGKLAKQKKDAERAKLRARPAQAQAAQTKNFRNSIKQEKKYMTNYIPDESCSTFYSTKN